MNPRAWPLRWKLTLWTAALVGVVLTLVGIGAAWHLYREGVDELDREMTRVAREFYGALPHSSEPVNWRSPEVISRLFPNARSTYLVEVLGPEGRVLYHSPSLHDEGLPRMHGPKEFGYATMRGKRMRIAAFEDKGYSLRVLAGMHSVEEVRSDLLRCYLVAAPVALALVFVGGWWIARRSFAPVDQLIAAAERITAQRLDHRLPVPPTSDEISRLSGGLNRMMDRLELSFRHATRFTADASHELKTPLTVIRGQLEAALREEDLTPVQERRLLELLEETEQLTHIVEKLLLLSRADAGRLQVEMKPVDLGALLAELQEDVEILAAPQEITIEADLATHAQVLGDEQFLRRLSFNLLENALKYNEVGGRIGITLKAESGRWVLSVGNTGPGITPEEGAHLFDRFYRGDSARGSGRGGHGLGLSICREIARAHGGEIALSRATPDWTEFRVTLPIGTEAVATPTAPAAAVAV